MDVYLEEGESMYVHYIGQYAFTRDALPFNTPPQKHCRVARWLNIRLHIIKMSKHRACNF
jgi:hypothetical protein